MARNNEKELSNVKSIDASLNNIDSKMQDIFQNTYNSKEDNHKVLNKITDDINQTINKILSGSEEIQNVPNITRLYTRIDNQTDIGSGGKKVEDGMNDLSDILSNKALINTISTTPDVNKYLKSLDSQYDMICKYMPKLEEALEIKKDNVLSADNFNKEFINVIRDVMDSEDKKLFNQRNTDLKKKYEFDQLADKIYDETSKYGEYFLWRVPYKKAFDQLLQSKGSIQNAVRFESVSIMENGSILNENGKNDSFADEDINTNINITFDQSNMLSESVIEYDKAERLKSRLRKTNKSLHESFNESVTDIVSEKAKLDKVFDPDLDYGKEFDNVANDGFVSNKKSDADSLIKDIPGCILKKLDHTNVVPLWIEDVCIGYYYFEFSYIDNYANPAKNNIINSSTFPSHNTADQGDNLYTENPMLKEVARRISAAVDAKFINANQDIKDEIYIMLKYNDQFNTLYDTNNIKVTFLPVEDVFHFYFKLDEETHHGISDLYKSLVPAMFWCLLDLSTTVGIVTRSQDKRIYYVKQNVETNVARTLMNVVNQVKKGNMGIRQMESMNNILNIVGRYNDHVIPLGPSGDPPIQFEVMQGQQIDIPEQLMNKWEESAINATDVPLEIVNSSMQADFAIKYTMSSSKFLRKVLKRQFVCENLYSDLYTSIYNYEFMENEKNIKVTLPAPAFLSMTNGAQLIQNTKEYIQQIADTEYAGSDDEKEKNEFIKLLLRYYLPTHINVPLIDKTRSQAKINTITSANDEKENE